MAGLAPQFFLSAPTIMPSEQLTITTSISNGYNCESTTRIDDTAGPVDAYHYDPSQHPDYAFAGHERASSESSINIDAYGEIYQDCVATRSTLNLCPDDASHELKLNPFEGKLELPESLYMMFFGKAMDEYMTSCEKRSPPEVEIDPLSEYMQSKCVSSHVELPVHPFVPPLPFPVAATVPPSYHILPQYDDPHPTTSSVPSPASPISVPSAPANSSSDISSNEQVGDNLLTRFKPRFYKYGVMANDRLLCGWNNCGISKRTEDIGTDDTYHQVCVQHIKNHAQRDANDEHRCYWGQCKDLLGDKRALERHLFSSHVVVRHYCPVKNCERSFSRKNATRHHIIVTHGAEEAEQVDQWEKEWLNSEMERERVEKGRKKRARKDSASTRPSKRQKTQSS
ncbi:hypothetical protein H0H93_010987 [Arthromyces matolae]|nr:hypothetical protein H0H93_010987 [Arthromyces matolae]